MSYATYTTRAIVCGSRDSYTSDKSFLLFTESAGMLWASARSVREERSRQRTALQDFSLIRVSLVRGKGGWRIGSVENEGNLFLRAHNRSERRAATQVIKLLRQFLHGEESVPQIFADVMTFSTVIAQTPTEHMPLVVDRFTLRLLHTLGYIAAEETYTDLLTASDWGVEPESLPKAAHAAIEKALHVSHL